MATYLISYDLGKPNRNYDGLQNAIKAYGTWAKPLLSVWIIKSDETAVAVRDKLKPFIDSDDKLLVVDVAGGWASLNLQQEVTNWLKTNL